MKRRDFLGTLVAGATMASLPISSFASPDPIIWNTATLTTSLENMFACRMGPPMSFCYFNSKTGDVVEPLRVEVQHPRFPNQTIEEFVEAPEGYSSYTYETYACMVEGGTAEAAEARMAEHFYNEFSKVPVGSLVWRVKPSFQSEEVVEYGKTFLTAEAAEDQLKKVVVGDVVIDVAYGEDGKPILPANVEYEWSSQNYRYVNRKYTLHKMRMRMVLPESYSEDEWTIKSLAFGPGGKPQII
jgi:hypothetical protein